MTFTTKSDEEYSKNGYLVITHHLRDNVLNNSTLLHADNSFVVMTKFRSSPQKVKYQDFTIRYTTPF